MLAHTNGQTVNLSKLGSSLEVSYATVRNYIDLLEGTFMVIPVRPYHRNSKKRLVKSPKIYLSDAGIITALMQLLSFEQAAGHPVFGSLWETAVLANLKGHFPNLNYSFYRTNHGDEIDLVLDNGSRHLTVECKATVAPSLTAGNHLALEDIASQRCLVAAPVTEGYPMKADIEVVSLGELTQRVNEYLY